MKNVLNKILIAGVGVLLAFVIPLTSLQLVGAANTPTLNQTINAGVLSTDILDASQVTVASPSFSMSAKTLAFTCQSGGSASTGTLGSGSQRVYVINPGGANNGFTLTIAATSGPTALWTAGGSTFDFNDTNACTDGADTDTKAGQLTIDPAVATLAADCTSCVLTNVTKGSSSAFVEGALNSVTLLTASLASDDVWRGYITGAGLSQVIPAEQAAGSYTINMTLTATAS